LLFFAAAAAAAAAVATSRGSSTSHQLNAVQSLTFILFISFFTSVAGAQQHSRQRGLHLLQHILVPTFFVFIQTSQIASHRLNVIF
jgi:hypothetical protein